METIMHKIQRLYSDMGPSEKKIADYILENTQEILSVSISELALRCGCGDATAVRFSRRLGFDGFQSLKIGLAQEFSSTSAISGEINRNDSCFDIFQKRITDISTALHNTEGVLDPESLEKAANLIMNADIIENHIRTKMLMHASMLILWRHVSLSRLMMSAMAN